MLIEHKICQFKDSRQMYSEPARYTVLIYIGESRQESPLMQFEITFDICWKTGENPSIEIISCTDELQSEEFLKRILESHRVYRRLKENITDFINQTMDFGEKHFYKRNYLWENGYLVK